MDPRQFGARADAVDLPAPKAYKLRDWNRWSEERKVKFIREMAEEAGRDPRIRQLAVSILQQAGAAPRDYPAQARALLRWVQQNVTYINERDEVLQDPSYTLRPDIMYGDCDDMTGLVGALFYAVRLDWRPVLSGHDRQGQKHRWIEGTPRPKGVTWSHIYAVVGWPPFRPTMWAFAEPTVKNAPLGWDVVSAAAQGSSTGGVTALGGYAPAITGAAGGAMATAVAGAEEGEDSSFLSWAQIGKAVVVGVATTVVSQIILDALGRSGAEKRSNGRKRRRR